MTSLSEILAKQRQAGAESRRFDKVAAAYKSGASKVDSRDLLEKVANNIAGCLWRADFDKLLDARNQDMLLAWLGKKAVVYFEDRTTGERTDYLVAILDRGTQRTGYIMQADPDHFINRLEFVRKQHNITWQLAWRKTKGRLQVALLGSDNDASKIHTQRYCEVAKGEKQRYLLTRQESKPGQDAAGTGETQ